MSILMFHDIRDHITFFEERYKLPYFIDFNTFLGITKKYKSNFKIKDELNIHNFLKENHIYTFDDGLKDHLSIARYLAKINIKAIFFVPSKIFDRDFIIESHKIQFLLASVNNNVLKEEIIEETLNYFKLKPLNIFEFEKSKWMNNIWSKEMIFCTRFFREFKNISFRKKLLDFFFDRYVKIPKKTIIKDFYLSKEDVFEISNLGHIIGGHGYESLNLEFENKSVVKNEIIKTSNFLNKLKTENKLFAYPNGGYNDFSVNLLKENGFKFGITTTINKNNVDDLNFKLQRVDATKLIF